VSRTGTKPPNQLLCSRELPPAFLPAMDCLSKLIDNSRMGIHSYNRDVTETFGYCVLSVGSKYPTIEAEVKTINNKLLLSNQRTLNW
jgi:hypothetical protein